MVGRFLGLFFGGGRNVVAETAEVFRENAEAGAQRDANYRQAALAQYGKEFHARNNRTWLDAFADSLNRLIRPGLVIVVMYPVIQTVRDPIGMKAVWEALATVPEGWWALVIPVVLFFFGGRMQTKVLDARMFQSAAKAVSALSTQADSEMPSATEDNPALREWADAQ
jgi:hypothetical protein